MGPSIIPTMNSTMGDQQAMALGVPIECSERRTSGAGHVEERIRRKGRPRGPLDDPYRMYQRTANKITSAGNGSQ